MASKIRQLGLVIVNQDQQVMGGSQQLLYRPEQHTGAGFNILSLLTLDIMVLAWPAPFLESKSPELNCKVLGN